MASSPAVSSPNAPPTPTNDAPNTASQGARERSNSSVPLAKRFKADHPDASAASPSTPIASTSANASANGLKPAAAAPEQKDNFDSLVDVMGASGVDLQAEEEAIQRRELMQQSQHAQQQQQQQQRGAAQADDDELFLQVYPLAYKVHTLAQQHGLSVDAAVLNYLSLAARTRLKNVLEAMIAASRHRSWSSHQHPPPLYASTSQPMYHESILSDPLKQLAALEKAERGDEARRRRERLARDQESSAAAAGLGGDGADMDIDDGTGTPRADGRKRPKKMGPGVAARNMSEDVRKRLADSTAMRNLGGGSAKYSWLSGGSSFPTSFSSPLGGKKAKAEAAADDDKTPSRLPKPKFAPQPAVSNWSGAGGADGGSAGGSAGAGSNAASAAGAWGDVTARQAAKDEEERQARLKVTLRDALFALEYERRAGAGHGSGEALLYRIRAGDEQFLKQRQV